MVRRYHFYKDPDDPASGPFEIASGQYVEYTDYAYRENDNKNLAMTNQALVERNVALEAECARLRRALQNVADCGSPCQTCVEIALQALEPT